MTTGPIEPAKTSFERPAASGEVAPLPGAPMPAVPTPPKGFTPPPWPPTQDDPAATR